MSYRDRARFSRVVAVRHLRLVVDGVDANDATARGDTMDCARLARVCQRIAEGYYNSPEVLDAVARSVVRSGALTADEGRGSRVVSQRGWR